MGVGTQVVDEVAPANVDHGTGRNEGAKTEVCPKAPVEDGGAQGTALAQESDITGAGTGASEGRVEPGGGAHQAEAVGADNAQFAFRRLMANGRFQFAPGQADFAETSRDNHGGFDIFGDAFTNDAGHRKSWRGDDREVNGSWDLVERRKCRIAEDGQVFGVDRVEFS